MLYRPKELISLLKEENIFPKKSLSQNFLIDGNIVRKIVDSADIHANDMVLEIGPGVGTLTEAILKKGARVIAVEKDTHLAELLKKRLAVEVITGDFLEIELKLPPKIKIVANLPYGVATPIITRILKNHHLFSSCTIMVQKELALRLACPRGTKEYRAFTILVNFFAAPHLLFDVPANCFYPRPTVKSTVLQLEFKEPPELDQEAFFAFVKRAFQQRRKSLASIFKIKDAPERAENLTVEELIALFKKMTSA